MYIQYIQYVLVCIQYIYEYICNLLMKNKLLKEYGINIYIYLFICIHTYICMQVVCICVCIYTVYMCVCMCLCACICHSQKNLSLQCSTQGNMLHKFNLYIWQIKLDIIIKRKVKIYTQTHIYMYRHIYMYTQYSNICTYIYCIIYTQKFCLLFDRSLLRFC